MHRRSDGIVIFFRGPNLFLSIEHRFAPTGKPIQLALVSDDQGNRTHLEFADHNQENSSHLPLTESVRQALAKANEPLTRTALRQTLRVNNQRLGKALIDLEKKQIATRSPNGWSLNQEAKPTGAVPADNQTKQLNFI